MRGEALLQALVERRAKDPERTMLVMSNLSPEAREWFDRTVRERLARLILEGASLSTNDPRGPIKAAIVSELIEQAACSTLEGCDV